MSILRRTFCFLLVAALLFVTAHRLPAPIQEVPESPTPAPQQSAKPKPKRTIKPKVASSPTVTPTARIQPTPQSRFAGAWSGVLTTNLEAIPETIIVDSTETTMTVICNSDGHRRSGAVKRDGDALKVTLGLWGTYWLTPSPDNSTAVVRYQNILDSRTALYNRTTSVPVSRQTNH